MNDHPPVYSGPWNADMSAKFLESRPLPLRLAVNHSNGFPLIISLWFVYQSQKFLLATQRDAKVVKRLMADERVGFEVAVNDPPYCGIRGTGIASIIDSPIAARPVLKQMLDRYLGPSRNEFRRWMLDRADREVLIEIRPRRLTSWDYRARMEKG